MKNTALLRSIPFWTLLILSLAAIGVGGWIATDQIGVMTATLLDGTATGIEVYAGQAWVVVGGALITGGIIGLFLALGIAAVKALLPRPEVAVVEAIDWSSESADEIPVADAVVKGAAEDAQADATAATDADVIDSDAVEQAETSPALNR